MATSGTTAFDLNIDDIIQEAYQRCAVRTKEFIYGKLNLMKML